VRREGAEERNAEDAPSNLRHFCLLFLSLSSERRKRQKKMDDEGLRRLSHQLLLSRYRGRTCVYERSEATTPLPSHSQQDPITAVYFRKQISNGFFQTIDAVHCLVLHESGRIVDISYKSFRSFGVGCSTGKIAPDAELVKHQVEQFIEAQAAPTAAALVVEAVGNVTQTLSEGFTATLDILHSFFSNVLDRLPGDSAQATEDAKKRAEAMHEAQAFGNHYEGPHALKKTICDSSGRTFCTTEANAEILITNRSFVIPSMKRLDTYMIHISRIFGEKIRSEDTFFQRAYASLLNVPYDLVHILSTGNSNATERAYAFMGNILHGIPSILSLTFSTRTKVIVKKLREMFDSTPTGGGEDVLRSHIQRTLGDSFAWKMFETFADELGDDDSQHTRKAFTFIAREFFQGWNCEQTSLLAFANEARQHNINVENKERLFSSLGVLEGVTLQ
jgi:hypothetical protein